VYLLECRSLQHSVLHVGLWTNPWALAGIAAVLALQAAFVYAPPMQEVFGSAPLSAEDWLLALAAAATVLPVVGLEKWWRRNRSFPKRKRGVIPMTGDRRGGTIEDTVL
jgi:Ca2+-transporting ATPase